LSKTYTEKQERGYLQGTSDAVIHGNNGHLKNSELIGDCDEDEGTQM
jgi:hypothetical protein